MTLTDFISKYQGQTKGYPNDQSYAGECLSIVKLFIKETFGITPPPSGSNSAYGYWSNFPDPLGTVFEKIPNTPTTVPQNGDIVIWKPWSTNPYGHIAIFISGNVNEFASFDQNWNGKQAHTQTHDYTNVIGWLHPKGSMYTEEQMSAVRIERDKNWNLYQAELKKSADLQTQLTACLNKPITSPEQPSFGVETGTKVQFDRNNVVLGYEKTYKPSE